MLTTNYSIKTLLLAVGITGGLMAVSGYYLRSAAELRGTTRQLRAEGVILSIRRGNTKFVAEPNGPLLQYIGASPVHVFAGNVEDRSVPSIADQIARLESLELISVESSLAPALLNKMKGFDELVVFQAIDAPITQSQLFSLLQQRRLQTLDVTISGDIVEADDFLQRLDCSMLTHICLRGVRVSDYGICHIAKAQRLEAIAISGDLGMVTDQSMEKIAALPRLRTFDLSGACITDAGLKVLRTSRTIEDLSLDNVRCKK